MSKDDPRKCKMQFFLTESENAEFQEYRRLASGGSERSRPMFLRDEAEVIREALFDAIAAFKASRAVKAGEPKVTPP